MYLHPPGTPRTFETRRGSFVEAVLLCDRSGCTRHAAYRLRDGSVWCTDHDETRRNALWRRTCKAWRHELRRAGVDVPEPAPRKTTPRLAPARNTWRKTRTPEHAYYVTSQDDTTWRVLRVHADPRKTHARVLCVVTSNNTPPDGDRGDVYASRVPGFVDAWCAAHGVDVTS